MHRVASLFKYKGDKSSTPWPFISFISIHVSSNPGTSVSMRAELHGEDGSRLSHWDEETSYFDELMTHRKNPVEYVLPVTIEVMKLLGHKAKENLKERTPLSTLIDQVKCQQFQRHEELAAIDTKYPKQQTEVLEHIEAVAALIVAF